MLKKSRSRPDHDVLFLCAPNEDYEGDGYCVCGWRCKSDISISHIYLQVVDHIDQATARVA